MKKLAAIFTFLLAFTISAHAQDAKPSADEAAKKDTAELAEYLGLTQDQQVNFIALFKHKYKVLNDATIPQERKDEMSRMVAVKINASIDENQKQKLAKNPELLEKLVK
ncbi:MAG TPA: hypothetical protein VF676_06105 [Flavobacterium sp.]|jgi:hypothetical protein